ncbi:MAG: hypothetical protein Q9211_004397 [Gyalolechia sp. 1 TL-2023]
MSAVLSGLASGEVSAAHYPPVPPIAHFDMSFIFERQFKLGVIDVYQTAIQMMYDLAQRSYVQTVQAVDSKQFGTYNVLFLFINTELPSRPQQLQVMHCVITLYRIIQVMTDDVVFCQTRAALLLQDRHIGSLSVTPIVDPATIARTISSSTDSIKEGENGVSNNTSNNILHGQITDPENPRFTIDFQFLGKSIKMKEVSMAVLEALTAAAPHPINAGCEEIQAVSPAGGCAIVIEGVPSIHHFTYQWATRALKLLYQNIAMAQKNFGDVELDLRYDGQIFGQLRMLKTLGDNDNGTEVLATER